MLKVSMFNKENKICVYFLPYTTLNGEQRIKPVLQNSNKKNI